MVFVPLRKTLLMKRFLLALAILLLSALACGARKLPAEALGTVQYEIRYTWGAIDAKVGTISISLNPASWENQAAYHSHGFLKTSSIFKLFIGEDLTVESDIAQSDLLPLHFLNPYRKGGKDCKFEFTYGRNGEIDALYQGPKETLTKTWPMDGKTFDLLSLLVFVRFRETADTPVKLKVLLDENCYPASLTYQGKDTEKIPGVETERFLLRLTERGVMENGSGNELLIWRSPGPDRRILCLEAPLKPGFMSIRIKE